MPPDETLDAETELAEVLGKFEAAQRRTAEIEARLVEEGGRLEKLWEAFKGQERDLWETRDRANRLDQDLRGKDDSAARLEDVIRERDGENRRLSEENDRLTEKIVEIEKRLSALSEVDSLRATAEEYKRKHAEYAERLAKLYALYEEIEAERDRLRRELSAQDEWFEENRAALSAVGGKLTWRGAMAKRKV